MGGASSSVGAELVVSFIAVPGGSAVDCITVGWPAAPVPAASVPKLADASAVVAPSSAKHGGACTSDESVLNVVHSAAQGSRRLINLCLSRRRVPPDFSTITFGPSAATP